MSELNTPATGTPDAASTASADAKVEQAKPSISDRVNGMLRTFLGSRSMQPVSAPATEEPKTADDASSDGADAPQAKPAEPAETSDTVTLSKEELDRKVQAEADRRD